MSQFEGLVSDVRRLNEARARRKEAERNNLIYAGEQLVFSTLVDCLPEGHPMRQEAVREHIAFLGRLAHAEGRTPGPIDAEAILSELINKHQLAVDRAADELESQQPQTKGLVFRHFEIRVRREPMRLNGVKSLEEAQNVRLRAAQIVRNTQFNTQVDAAAAVRRAMGER
jgi:hypothetical protein